MPELWWQHVSFLEKISKVILHSYYAILLTFLLYFTIGCERRKKKHQKYPEFIILASENYRAVSIIVSRRTTTSK